WVVEDALQFVQRELKRGNKYQGVIIDPPAYGHRPKGEKWKLEVHNMEVMREVVPVLDQKQHFIILNTYSLGFLSVIVENHIRTAMPQIESLELGELYFQATAGQQLPLGVFGNCR